MAGYTAGRHSPGGTLARPLAEAVGSRAWGVLPGLCTARVPATAGPAARASGPGGRGRHGGWLHGWPAPCMALAAGRQGRRPGWPWPAVAMLGGEPGRGTAASTYCHPRLPAAGPPAWQPRLGGVAVRARRDRRPGPAARPPPWACPWGGLAGRCQGLGARPYGPAAHASPAVASASWPPLRPGPRPRPAVPQARAWPGRGLAGSGAMSAGPYSWGAWGAAGPPLRHHHRRAPVVAGVAAGPRQQALRRCRPAGYGPRPWPAAVAAAWLRQAAATAASSRYGCGRPRA